MYIELKYEILTAIDKYVRVESLQEIRIILLFALLFLFLRRSMRLQLLRIPRRYEILYRV